LAFASYVEYVCAILILLRLSLWTSLTSP